MTWHLLNASPDLRAQIEAHRELQPDPARGSRHTPIQSVVLTNADLDHVLGLLLLRESQPLCVYASDSVTRVLLEDNSFFGMLRQQASQTRWIAVKPGEPFELRGPGGESSGLFVEPHTVSDRYPFYVKPERRAQLRADEAVFGLVVREGARRVGYFPGVGRIPPELLAVFESCDALFVDGTFWTNDELQRVHGTARTALEMAHVPLSGPDGMIAQLSVLKKPRKIFVHINNTNPILDPKSDACREATRAGWEVGRDGLEIRL